MTLTDKDLRALALKATDGPWRYQEQSDAYTHIVRAGESRFICQLSQTGKQSEANSRFIAAANPQTVIGLLDRIAFLESENLKLKEAMLERGL